MTRQFYLRGMLVALAASALLAIVSIYASSDSSWRLLATTALAAVSCGLLLPVAPREAGQTMDLLQRTLAGYILVSFAVCMTGVWELPPAGAGSEILLVWFAIGVPALAVCAAAMRHRRRADRSLALAERTAMYGACISLVVALICELLGVPGRDESPFLIGYACIAGTIVSAASAIGRRGASTERFNPPPASTGFDRVVGSIGLPAGFAWSALSAIAIIEEADWVRFSVTSRSSMFWPLAIGCMTVALGGAIWCGLGLSRVTGVARFLRHAAFAASCALGMLAVYLTAMAANRTSFTVDRTIAQLMQVLAIVGIASLLAALTSMRLSRGHTVAADPIESIDWKCPRCGTQSRIGTGDHSCAGCGLAVRLSFRDDRCPACAYDLRGQSEGAQACPECGRARQMA